VTVSVFTQLFLICSQGCL